MSTHSTQPSRVRCTVCRTEVGRDFATQVSPDAWHCTRKACVKSRTKSVPQQPQPRQPVQQPAPQQHPDYDHSLVGVEPRCTRCGRLVYNCTLAGECDPTSPYYVAPITPDAKGTPTLLEKVAAAPTRPAYARHCTECGTGLDVGQDQCPACDAPALDDAADPGSSGPEASTLTDPQRAALLDAAPARTLPPSQVPPEVPHGSGGSVTPCGEVDRTPVPHAGKGARQGQQAVATSTSPPTGQKGRGQQVAARPSTKVAQEDSTVYSTDPHCDHHRPARTCRYCLALLKARYAADSVVVPVTSTNPHAAYDPRSTEPVQMADPVSHHDLPRIPLPAPVPYASRVQPTLPVAYVTPPLPCTNSPRRGTELAGPQGVAFCDVTETATQSQVLQVLRYSNMRCSDATVLEGCAHAPLTVHHSMAKALCDSGLARIELMHRSGRHRRSVVVVTADRAESRDPYLHGSDVPPVKRDGSDDEMVEVKVEVNGGTKKVTVTRAVARLMKEQAKDTPKRDRAATRKAREEAASRGWSVDDCATRVSGDHHLERWLVITEAGRRHVDRLEEQQATEEQQAAALLNHNQTRDGYTPEQAKALARFDLTTAQGKANWDNLTISATDRLGKLVGWTRQRGESGNQYADRVEAMLRHYHAERKAGVRKDRASVKPAPTATPDASNPHNHHVPAPSIPGLASGAEATRGSEDQADPAHPGMRLTVLRGYRPGTVLPTVLVQTARPALTWKISVRSWRQWFPGKDQETGETRMMSMQCRALYATAETSDEGSTNALPNYWRVWVVSRAGRGTSYSLASSSTGSDGTWVKDRTLTEGELVAWLDGRSNGAGRFWLASLLS